MTSPQQRAAEITAKKCFSAKRKYLFRLLFDKYFERFPRSFQGRATHSHRRLIENYKNLWHMGHCWWWHSLVTLSLSACQNICSGFRQFSGDPPLPPEQCSARPAIFRSMWKRACKHIVTRSKWEWCAHQEVCKLKLPADYAISVTSTVCPLLTSIFPTSPMMKSPALAWTLYILCSSLLSKSTLTSLTS